jgi:hypothetical protein
MHLKHGAGAPLEWIVWQMVYKTHWTLEYIEGLSMERIHEYLKVEDGSAKARS